MRRPARPNPSRNKRSVGASVPAPVLGLNARDELANMDPRYAITLTNGFPEADRVVVRRGYASHGTGMTDPVESVMAWLGPASTKFISAAGTVLYDTTSAGAGSSQVTGLTNARWQHVNFTTSGGHYLIMVNGADTPRSFDGTTHATTSITGSGLTSTDLIGVTSHKERLWFIESGTASAWYLGTSAIAGTATEFPLGAVFKEGGYLMAAGTYSDDAGDGIDDYIAFVSSTGEVLLYQGTDPSSANTWGLVGRYRTGKPLGRRCLTNLGGDLLILTDRGVVSLKSIIKYDREQQEFASVSNKIDPLISDAARDYYNNFGWQIMVYPKAKWLVVNVPLSENDSQVQYVMNVLTGAWCKFDSINANCFGASANNIYFGGNDGKKYECDSGYQDNSAKITCDIKTAFNYFESRGVQKHFTMVRALMSSTGTPDVVIGSAVDFGEESPTGDITPTALDAATWDNAVWDTDVWAGLSQVTRKWTALKTVGMCMAILFRVSIRGGSCAINSFDVVAEPGGTL